MIAEIFHSHIASSVSAFYYHYIFSKRLRIEYMTNNRMAKMKKKRKGIGEEEIDCLVIAQTEDKSAWDKPSISADQR